MKFFEKISSITETAGKAATSLKAPLLKLTAGVAAAGTGLYLIAKKPKREWNQGIIR